MIHKIKHLPKSYFNTPQELAFIKSKFQYIPVRFQKSVSDKYESLYLKNKYGRKAANEYLTGVSNEYRQLERGVVIHG